MRVSLGGSRRPNRCRTSRSHEALWPSPRVPTYATLANVFARYYLELPLPAEEVERLLTSAPESWIPGLAREADGRGEQLLADVGFGHGSRLDRSVAIDLGRPIRMVSKTILPLKWRAARTSGLIPSLDADLEVAALGPRLTQLAMSARYLPPFGALGKAIDRGLLHRVAEATLKDFLDRVAAALLAESGAPLTG